MPKSMAIMAVPMIISQLITLIYNLADTWFIGQTNNPYMVAGCSLVLTAFMLTIVIANVFGVGGGTLVSRLLGAKEPEEASKVASVSFWMSLASALVYSAVCLFAMNPFLKLLGASENTLQFARQYMFFVIVIGGSFTVMASTMSSMLRSIGYASLASTGLMIGGLLNIALDPLFMFVILPDGKQVMGAAIATMISNMVSFLYFFVVYRRLGKDSFLSFSLKNGLPKRSSFRSVFAVGVPAAMSLLLFDLSNIVINRLSAGHGDIELAAIGIVLKAERLPLNTGIGLCLGMIPLLAYNYSAKNYKRMDEIFDFTRITGLVFSVLCVVLYRVFASQIMSAFIRDEATVRFGTQFLKARCFATPMMFLCFSMVHFTQAIGDGKLSFILAVVRQLVFNIPLLFLLNHLFGMNGIVWTQLIADTLTVAVSYILYFRLRKQKNF
ncbi:MAG: MATE family efflux transporter [Lachnospiraceae bacterium]|nr:MATE family efflux transporter [Lachnospiraceae bacterium]